MQKMIHHTTVQLTVHKLKISVALISLLFCSSCWVFHWDVQDENFYDIHVKNASNDTLLIDFDGRNGTFNYENLLDFVIYPDSSLMCSGLQGIGGEEGFDPVEKMFSGRNYDSCCIYQYNSDFINEAIQLGATRDGYITINRKYLKAVWKAPMRKMGDSINSFFNADAWDYYFIDEKNGTGIVQFTIYADDFFQ